MLNTFVLYSEETISCNEITLFTLLPGIKKHNREGQTDGSPMELTLEDKSVRQLSIYLDYKKAFDVSLKLKHNTTSVYKFLL